MLCDKGNINISSTNTINISGGTIEGDILATEDSGNYKGSLRRTSNNINISGGKIGGNVEGGAGAENNVITITGGQFTPLAAEMMMVEVAAVRLWAQFMPVSPMLQPEIKARTERLFLKI